MRFSVAAVLAFAASAFAQTPDFDPVYTPKKDETVTAGSSFTLTWDAPPKYVDGTISIELIGGATQNTQQPIAKIASGVKNSAKTYTWNVDAALGDKNVYGLVFKLDSDPSVFQYSNPFHIKASGSKSTGSDAVTLTTSQGVKTILLSSTTPTSTAAPSTTCTGSNTSTTSSSSSSSSTTTTATAGRSLQLLVDRVDGQQALRADGSFDGIFIIGIDLEGLGDAVDSDVYRVPIFSGKSAIRGGSGQEVADGERQALLGCKMRSLYSRAKENHTPNVSQI